MRQPRFCCESERTSVPCLPRGAGERRRGYGHCSHPERITAPHTQETPSTLDKDNNDKVTNQQLPSVTHKQVRATHGIGCARLQSMVQESQVLTLPAVRAAS